MGPGVERGEGPGEGEWGRFLEGGETGGDGGGEGEDWRRCGGEETGRRRRRDTAETRAGSPRLRAREATASSLLV